MHPSPEFGGRPPRDLAGLVTRGLRLRRLAADAGTLAQLTGLFDRIAATTAGPHAWLVQRCTGQSRMALHLGSDPGQMLVASDADAARREPAALHLFSAQGAALHRIQITAPTDMATLDAILRLHDAGPPSLPRPPVLRPDGPLSLPALRAVQDAWDGTPARHHLAALAREGLGPGIARARCLPHLRGAAARRIEPSSLWDLLQGVAQAGLPLRRGVLRPGCLHEMGDCLNAATRDGALITLLGDGDRMMLDLSGVAHGWLTRWDHGQATEMVLELYDANLCPIALFRADGPPGSLARDEWGRRALRMAEPTTAKSPVRARLRESPHRARHLHPVGRKD